MRNAGDLSVPKPACFSGVHCLRSSGLFFDYFPSVYYSFQIKYRRTRTPCFSNTRHAGVILKYDISFLKSQLLQKWYTPLCVPQLGNPSVFLQIAVSVSQLGTCMVEPGHLAMNSVARGMGAVLSAAIYRFPRDKWKRRMSVILPIFGKTNIEIDVTSFL